MSNIRVVSHFSTKSEKERKQSFNDLAKMMVVGLSTTNSAETIRDLCDVTIADFLDEKLKIED